MHSIGGLETGRCRAVHPNECRRQLLIYRETSDAPGNFHSFLPPNFHKDSVEMRRDTPGHDG